jgi:8-oxo-dGTP pyrophosphatase MutT (NUDIX family)
MTISALEEFLQSRLASPLPGDVAHRLMRARAMGTGIPNFTHKLPPRPGAVLILLYPVGDKIYFPLIRRQEYVGAHSGQVSLPGGKAESGETAIDTALRESEEEIGIDRKQPRILGQLTNFHVIPSNFLITPIVATLDHVPVFKPDPYEVASVLSADLQNLLDDNAILEAEILAAGQYKMIAPHFMLDGAMVWGATAMMLNEFRQVLSEFKSQ